MSFSLPFDEQALLLCQDLESRLTKEDVSKASSTQNDSPFKENITKALLINDKPLMLNIDPLHLPFIL